MDEDIRISEIQASRILAQTREYTRIAKEYHTAVNACDLQAIAKTLHPELHFVGPTGEVHNRESFLEVYNKVFANLEKLDITAEALSDNLIYFKYYMVLPAPIGPIQGSMQTTHAEDGLIKKIEMTYHPAMVENHLNRYK